METIVLYPSPGMGHLISMVEFGKFILRHHPSSSITILTHTSFTTASTAAYITAVSSSVPSITFHHLPPIDLDIQSFPSMEAVLYELVRLSNPHVRAALETISATSSAVLAFVIDFFCTASMPIAKEFNIPTYFFFTSGACVLAFFFYFPTVHKNTTKSFREMNTNLEIPGVPPMPTTEMIRPLRDRDTVDYNSFLDFAVNLPNSSGVIINTFERLEPKPLKAVREGKCNPDTKPPPIFCIGPLLATEDGGAAFHDCMKWLDKQPSKSVIFLCFGSMGLFSAAQLTEIAIGLENCGHRFLWVVRPPPAADKSKPAQPLAEPDLDALLPAGFLDRTADRGYVLKSWAPQLAVLGHGAVGGFVTHCGWNSVLEAVCNAVPMVAWPLYAEQHYNRRVVVEDMKLALRLEEDAEGFVAAEEVERGVRELMDTDAEKGKEIRKAVEEMSVAAREAMGGGGNSAAALGKLVELWRSGVHN